MAVWNQYEVTDMAFETWEEMMARLAAGGVTTNGFESQPTPTKPSTTTEDAPPTRTASQENLTSAKLIEAYGKGLMDEATLKARLTELGYDEGDVGLLVAMGQKTAEASDAGLSLSTLFNARDKGVIDNDQLTARLSEAGYDPSEVDILLRTNTPEAPKKDLSGTVSADQNAYEKGVINAEDYAKRLRDRGYDDSQIRAALIRDPEKARGPSGGNVSGPVRPIYDDASVQVVGGGGGGTRPQARQVLDDFRTSFAKNLKSNSEGLSMPAKQWAAQNMDLFLNDFLGAGGSQNSGFTLGAQQIQSLYEGSRGMAGASRRTGGGAQQVRDI